MLAYQWHKTSGIPVVLLHGLLGSQQDWAEVLTHLQNDSAIRPLTIDLPYHGKSQANHCIDFNQMRNELDLTLKAVLNQQAFWLVGYSLGGRIALDYTLNIHNPFLLGTLLEGTHLGLATKAERELRRHNDQKWANRFRLEPIEKVLNDWYQQPVFTHLTAQQRTALIAERRDNQGQHIAQMLEATSLAKQDYYALAIEQQQKRLPVAEKKRIAFLVGEHDQQFHQQAERYKLTYKLIPNAGHNTHKENPQKFVQTLLEILNS